MRRGLGGSTSKDRVRSGRDQRWAVHHRPGHGGLSRGLPPPRRQGVRQHRKCHSSEYLARAWIPPRGEADYATLARLASGDCGTSTALAVTPWRRSQPRRFRPKDTEAVRRRRATANRVLTYLKAALNHAWRAGLVPSDDAWRRVKPFRSVDAPVIRYLSHDEITRLLTACQRRLSRSRSRGAAHRLPLRRTLPPQGRRL